MNPKHIRETMAKTMFETFHTPAVYVTHQARLSLLACGRTTGVALQSGYNLSHAVPVYEGYVLPHAIVRLHVGGADLEQYLLKLLSEKGYSFPRATEAGLVRDIQQLSYVASNFKDALSGPVQPIIIRLPDDTEIELRAELSCCPELLFNPNPITR